MVVNGGEAMAVPVPPFLTSEVIKIKHAGLNLPGRFEKLENSLTVPNCKLQKQPGRRVNANSHLLTVIQAVEQTTCCFLPTLPGLILLRLHLFTIGTLQS